MRCVGLVQMPIHPFQNSCTFSFFSKIKNGGSQKTVSLIQNELALNALMHTENI